MSRKAKTVTVREGPVTVKIFWSPTGKYPGWTVTHYWGGKRIRRKFSRLDRARDHAAEVAGRIARGETAVWNLSASDVSAYCRALELLEPTGAAIESAAAEYAEAKTRLSQIAPGVRLIDAVESYGRTHKADSPPVAEVVAQLLETKAADGRSPRHLRDLRHRLERFAADFHCPIASVKGDAIDSWLRALKTGKGRPMSARARVNYRTALSNLFGFAGRRRYLPRDWDEMATVEIAKDAQGEIGIFTPDQMALFLGCAPPPLVPVLAIGAFAGLRTSEIERLQWSGVRFESSAIIVPAATKTGRRVAPMPANLRAWLAPFVKAVGPVCSYSNLTNAFGRLSAKAGVRWVPNGLRHSFASYRVAQISNVPQVAAELGNSPAVILSRYREIVLPADAERWFGIFPEDALRNVISLPAK